ncbi:unnamed protein product, partial [Oikopleura dioica]
QKVEKKKKKNVNKKVVTKAKGRHEKSQPQVMPF